MPLSLRLALRSALVGLALTTAAVSVGCTARSGPPVGTRLPDGGLLVPTDDAGDRTFDGGGFYNPDGSGPLNPCGTGCGPTEICGAEGSTEGGNGLDDNCNGQVDEGCTCAPGEVRECFAGTPDRRNIGVCSDGVESCSEFGIWGACLTGTSPHEESCNGSDDDCNGVTDDIAGCTSAVTCPGNESARPLSTHTLQGSRVTPTGTNWRWGIECPATVPLELCPRLLTPNAQNTDLYFSASGAYRVSVTVTLADGTDASCAWTVYVQGGGLRVELNWSSMLDTAGGTDVDLHLHRWTRNGVDTDFFSEPDDCYYGNCQPDDDYSWPGHPDSDLENCQDAAHGGGATWRAAGACRNPRLDVDTNGTDGACSASQTDPNQDDFCAPENINVDDPVIGTPYRVMVNYYSDHGFAGTTYPSVNIFCGGSIRGAFGLDPLVSLRNGGDYGAANDNYYVADIVFFEGTCGLDCMVYPVGTVTQGTTDPSDPFGFTSIAPFGPAWSCNYDGARACTP